MAAAKTPANIPHMADDFNSKRGAWGGGKLASQQVAAAYLATSSTWLTTSIVSGGGGKTTANSPHLILQVTANSSPHLVTWIMTRCIL